MRSHPTPKRSLPSVQFAGHVPLSDASRYFGRHHMKMLQLLGSTLVEVLNNLDFLHVRACEAADVAAF